ncbi:hypothetical protein [Cohnella herbarum]|uniref:Uncharacterized protein n=1 Tax=Cohnella herbarum TaxID=2728023 RepID=A0A7Z2VRE2_9BACL|nr:hypothetical protein [Cohnella herbarum]QJD87540.1 hypothetical protein HH215_33080 [Cohnella herbarum]
MREMIPAGRERSGETERWVTLLTRLNNRKSLPHLLPDQVWHPGLDEEIAAIPIDLVADGRPDGTLSAMAWKAALHLWNDSLDAAHALVEHMNTPTGAALHGIMHRREGDFDNAKYWFHQAGNHPAYHGLQSRAAAFLGERRIPRGSLQTALLQIASQGSWNAYLFVNVVAIQQRCVDEQEAGDILEYLQQLELEAFIRFLEGRIAVSSWKTTFSDDD